MRYLFIILFMSTVLGLSSCDKIVAKDITNELPVLILPAANDTTNQNPIQFKWEEVEGASKYHLEVVSTSFTSIQSFDIDSMVTGTEIFLPLDSNEYELKLTAMNGGYSSQTLGPIKFWTGSQPSSSSGTINLTSPADGIYVNLTFNNLFEWSAISEATSYEFILRQGSSFETGTNLTNENNLSTAQFTEPFLLTEGEYHWGVQGHTSNGATGFSTRTFYVDETDPNIATLTAPLNGAFESVGQVTFTWNNGTDGGTIQSPVHSLLEVATDAGFTLMEATEEVIDGNTTTVTLPLGTYFWRVSNTDEAGNTAGESATNQLIVN